MKMLLQNEVHPNLLLTCFVSMMTKINEQNNQKKSTAANLMSLRFSIKGLFWKLILSA